MLIFHFVLLTVHVYVHFTESNFDNHHKRMQTILTKFCKKTDVQNGGHATESLLANFILKPACYRSWLRLEKQQIQNGI